MRLKVIGTGSQGNAYLLYNEQEALLIECGVGIKDIKVALDFNLTKLVGCIMTHEHQDHSKSTKDLISAGIEVFSTKGTFDALNIEHHNARPLKRIDEFQLGGFRIKNFDVKHDAAAPSGFLIQHKECGTVLFLTDTYYCPYTFPGLNNIIIEANYSMEIIQKKLYDKAFLKNRVLQSHMNLDTCIKTLQANDLSQVNNIVLIHLSDSNSNEKTFQEKVSNATSANVTVASNGMDLNFNKTPFA